MNLQVGSAITFKYNGGTNPGETRTVYVTEVYNHTISSYCFNRKGIRNFTIGKMSDIKFMSVSRLRTDVLPKNVDNIVAGFEADGKIAYHDKTRGEIITWTPPKYSLGWDGTILTLTGPKGSVNVNLRTMLMQGSDSYIIKNATAENYIKAVQSLG